MINHYFITGCRSGHSVRTTVKTVRRTLRTPLGVVRRVSGEEKKRLSGSASLETRPQAFVVLQAVPPLGIMEGQMIRKHRTRLIRARKAGAYGLD